MRKASRRSKRKVDRKASRRADRKASRNGIGKANERPDRIAKWKTNSGRLVGR